MEHMQAMAGIEQFDPITKIPSIKVPQTCQYTKGQTATEFVEAIHYSDEEREEKLAGLIAQLGLSEDNDQFRQLKMEAFNLSPLRAGFQGIMPMENIMNARFAQGSTFNNQKMDLKVGLDDLLHYPEVLKILAPKMNRAFGKQGENCRSDSKNYHGYL